MLFLAPLCSIKCFATSKYAFFMRSFGCAFFIFIEVLKMSKLFTVSFFIDECSTAETVDLFCRLEEEVPQLFKEHEAINFLHCAENRTDSFVHKYITETRSNFAAENYLTFMIYPYSHEGFVRCACHEKTGHSSYEKHRCFSGAENGDSQTAAITRNKKMVDISDLSFFCIRNQNGTVNATLEYARKNNKEIIILQ